MYLVLSLFCRVVLISETKHELYSLHWKDDFPKNSPFNLLARKAKVLESFFFYNFPFLFPFPLLSFPRNVCLFQEFGVNTYEIWILTNILTCMFSSLHCLLQIHGNILNYCKFYLCFKFVECRDSNINDARQFYLFDNFLLNINSLKKNHLTCFPRKNDNSFITSSNIFWVFPK